MRNLVLDITAHLGIRLAFVLETGVPAWTSVSYLIRARGSRKQGYSPKSVGPLAGTILPCQSYQSATRNSRPRGTEESTDISTSLEDNHLMSRTFTIRKGADGLCGLVFKTGKQFVELVDAESF